MDPLTSQRRGRAWLSSAQSRGGRLLALAAVAALAWALGVVAPPVHDWIGTLVPGPSLPSLVVEADGPLGPAAAAVRAAGARSVVAALPAGHPLLDGVPPEPPGLRADATGRVRWFDETRLPLPEALPRLSRSTVGQLDPGNPAQLAGRDVVLDLADPALGIAALAPGADHPVDRAELLAIGLGARQVGHGLRTLPWWAVLGAAVAVAALASAVLDRVPVAMGMAGCAAVAAGWVVAVVAGRAFAVNLPLEAAVAALGLPVLLRVWSTNQLALLTLDRVALRVGAASRFTPARSSVEARAFMAGLFAPGHAVASWTLAVGGHPERTVWEGDEMLFPVLDALPGASLAEHGWRIEPVFDEGTLVGAIALARKEGLSPDVSRVLEAVARSPRGIAEVGAPADRDPVHARLQLVSEAVDGSLREADLWRGLLGPSGLTIGLFELGGDLVAAGEPLKERLPAGTTNPLVDLLQQTTGFERDLVRTVLRRAIAEPAPRRIPSAAGGEEVVLQRVLSEGRPVGLLVQIHDVRPHLRLDELKSNLLLAGGVRMRDTLSTLGGYAEMAIPADTDGGKALKERIRVRIAEAVHQLDQAEALSRTRVGESPIQPVYLGNAVNEAIAGLDPQVQGRIVTSFPSIASPVAARTAPLVRSLAELLGVLAGHGGRVSAEVSAGSDRMSLVLRAEAGGLPDGMLARLVDPDSPSAAGGAVAQICEMGATFSPTTSPEEGTVLGFAFPYF